MDIRKRIETFTNNGISQKRIAKVSKVNKNTMTAIISGKSVNPDTLEKVKSGLKDIALEIYNSAFADEVEKEEEWED